MKRLIALLLMAVLSVFISLALCSCGDDDYYYAYDSSSTESAEDSAEDFDYHEWLLQEVENMEWVMAENAKEVIGYEETVCDYVYSVSKRDDIEGSPIFINLGADYPSKDRCQVVIWEGAQNEYEELQDLSYMEETGEAFAVTGLVEEYDGVAQIEVTSPDQIQIVEP